MNIFTLILLMILLSLLSAILYRLGGCSKEDFPKVPGWLKDGLTRDIGCGAMSVYQVLTVCNYFEIELPLWKLVCYAVIALWGLKSYWSWLNKILYRLHYKTGKMTVPYFMWNNYYSDKQWWNWLLVGLTMSSRWFFVFGWKAFPYVIINGLLIMFVSLKFGGVNKEEFARGALFIL